MANSISIHWFRNDLRLADNPALSAAAAAGDVVPVYILDDENAGIDAMGAASRWWLHHSLTALDKSLGGHLCVLRGDAKTLIAELAKSVGATEVHWNRCYEPWRIARDSVIKTQLQESGITATSHNGSLLWEPWDVKKDDGTPYKVFTPFYRKGCMKAAPPRVPIAAPSSLNKIAADLNVGIGALELLPDTGWNKTLDAHWVIGEAGAMNRFTSFVDDGLVGYKDGRNFPAKQNVSRLSPYLHWGEISPHQIWASVQSHMDAGLPTRDADHFLSEIGWREFSYSLLYHNPELRRRNLQPKFDKFPWHDDADALARWQRGMTGYPIVDAAMRELWQTGYMHNRLRMVVGSFLVKNLRLHWHHGEAWFWDCLADADHANNSASWQWIAGCGADAAPYFRVFNPITQGVKFDEDGAFTRHYVPELAAMPDKYLFNPWEAPAEILAAAGVTLGETYPQPVVDVKLSREAALEAFAMLKQPDA
ncbi:DNA photolyase family protein [Alphaproteobacteria bacterium]|nr:DNA photolyase family protein [Alphaproteobacteria bacterium]